MEQIVFVLDKIGIFACAFVSVSHGIRKKLDVFGLLLVGIIGAIGGGMVRDISLARVPYAITNSDYMLIATVISMLAIFLYHLKRRIPTRILLLADTIGMAAFAISGANLAMQLQLNFFIVVLFAVITATGGGFIRDIMLNDVPFILKREIYATAAGAGGVVFFVCMNWKFGYVYSTLLALSFIIILRSYAVTKRLNLPILK